MEYSFDCKIRKLSVKTIQNYQKQLRYLQRYLEQEYGVKAVEEVCAYQIKEFLAMMDDKQRKPRYINDLLKVFRTFFNYPAFSLKRRMKLYLLKPTHSEQDPALNCRLYRYKLLSYPPL